MVSGRLNGGLHQLSKVFPIQHLGGCRRECTVLLAEDPPRCGVHAVNQRPVNVVVDTLVARIDSVLVVRGLHQVAVAERLGCDLFGFDERSGRVVVVADYQYRQASAVVRSLNRFGGELVVERADVGDADVN